MRRLRKFVFTLYLKLLNSFRFSNMKDMIFLSISYSLQVPPLEDHILLKMDKKHEKLLQQNHYHIFLLFLLLFLLCLVLELEQIFYINVSEFELVDKAAIILRNQAMYLVYNLSLKISFIIKFIQYN